MFYLLANNGPQQGRRYELKGEKYVLGRHPDCDIHIEVGAVSRNHCQIVRDGSGYALEDLGSRNGTFVNDEQPKVEGRRPLRLGDVLRVCEVSFTFLNDTAPKPNTGMRTEEFDGAGLGAFIA
ncbi:MAG TPA: FHA domain-containing protein, partial [Pirellulaceae bacterium]|nr:FHA domain-containing protein [Pirellulaceae bacterium]